MPPESPRLLQRMVPHPSSSGSSNSSCERDSSYEFVPTCHSEGAAVQPLEGEETNDEHDDMDSIMAQIMETASSLDELDGNNNGTSLTHLEFDVHQEEKSEIVEPSSLELEHETSRRHSSNTNTSTAANNGSRPFPATVFGNGSTTVTCQPTRLDESDTRIPALVCQTDLTAASHDGSKATRVAIEEFKERDLLAQKPAAANIGAESPKHRLSKDSKRDSKLAQAMAREEQELLLMKQAAYEGRSVPPLPANYATENTHVSPATVLPDRYPYSSTTTTQDSLLARALTEEEEVLAALKRAAYEGHSASLSDQQQQQATVVEIDDESATRGGQDVQAHCVGVNFAVSATASQNVATNDNGTATNATVEEQSDAQEATVIDSAPVEKQDDQEIGRAEVLLDSSTPDRKPPPPGAPIRRRRSRRVEEAEVTDIQEYADIHPDERGDEDAHALYVCSDRSCTVAVPSTSAPAVDETAPRARAVVTNRPTDNATSTVASAIVPSGGNSSGPEPEQAQVLMERCFPNFMDRKPPAVHRRRGNNHGFRSTNLCVVAEQEGEVLDVQEGEDVHPVVRREETGTEAELVGMSPSPAVASSVATLNRELTTQAAALSRSLQPDIAFPVDNLLSARSNNLPAPNQAFALASRISKATETLPPTRHNQETEVRPDSTSGQAEVVSMRDIDDIHPAERDDSQTVSVEGKVAVAEASENDQMTDSVRASMNEQASVVSIREAEDVHPEETNDSTLQTMAVLLDSMCESVQTTPHANQVLTTEATSVGEMNVLGGGTQSGSAEVVDEDSSQPLGNLSPENVSTLVGARMMETSVPAPIAGQSSFSSVFAQPVSNRTSSFDPHESSSSSLPAAAVGVSNDRNASHGTVVSIQSVDEFHPAEHEVRNSAVAHHIGAANVEDQAASTGNDVQNSIRVNAVLAGSLESFPGFQPTTVSDPVVSSTMEDDVSLRHPSTVSNIAGVLPAATLEAVGDSGRITPVKETPYSGAVEDSAPLSNAGPSTTATGGYSLDWLRSQALERESDEARLGDSNREVQNNSTRSGEHVARSTAAHLQQMIADNLARGTSSVVNTLFGESPQQFVQRKPPSNEESYAVGVKPRTLLPWSVIINPATNAWVATLQTNQRALDTNSVSEASKSLRAFIMPSEKQAICLAKAWTPPRMEPFEEHKFCHLCDAKFAVFRRSCHCRNCGVCVCKDCAVQWPSKMIPDTYNIKKEKMVNVCKSCNWLCNSFRKALLEGDLDQSYALYSTGNVNLHSPFENVKGEVFYPVHCAVLGGNLKLLRFLVDENCCPIKSVRVHSGPKDTRKKLTPIVTSKGRSLLGIAMNNDNTEMIRYLVVEKGVEIAHEPDITVDVLCRNFNAVLRLLPADSLDDSGRTSLDYALDQTGLLLPTAPILGGDLDGVVPITPNNDENERTLSQEAFDFGAVQMNSGSTDRSQEESSIREECIICCDNTIDCVATPCGHQMCCQGCGENLSSCPVCAAECSFMRVYKA